MKLRNLLLLTTISILLSYSANATHVMGSEIEYKSIGNHKYNVKIRIYRDCNGVILTTPMVVAKSGTTVVNLTDKRLLTKKDITNDGPLCLQSKCAGDNSPYGIEESTYEMVLDLSNYSECEWVISWEDCCRNSSISTGPANENFYTMAILNKCLAPNNSSPSFTSKPTPVAIVCADSDISYNFGAQDLVNEDDSISYELVNGLIGPNSPVTYTGSFSPARPLTFLGFPNQNTALPGGFHLNPVTGQLAFRPVQANQVGIIVVEVKEWRKIDDTMRVIGKIRRDMQIIVTNCPDNDPLIFSGSTDFDVCYGHGISIPINVTNSNPDRKVYITWDAGLPGAFFINRSSLNTNPLGEVEWRFNPNLERGKTYSFEITAKDDFCQNPKTATQKFNVYLVPPSKATFKTDLIDCNTLTLSHSAELDTSNYTFNHSLLKEGVSMWYTNKKRLDTLVLTPGTYINALGINDELNCNTLFMEKFVVTDSGGIFNTQDMTLCEGDTAHIVPKYKGDSSNRMYDWYELKDGTLSPILETSSSYSGIPAGVSHYIGIAQVGDCKITDTTRIVYNPKPNIQVSNTPGIACLNDATIQFFDSVDITSGNIILREWDFGDGEKSDSINPLHKYQSSGIYTARFTVLSDKGCSNSDSQEIVIKPMPKLDSLQNRLNVPLHSNQVFFVGTNNPQYQYLWQTDTGLGFFIPIEDIPYLGTTKATLYVLYIPANLNNSKFRCIVTYDGCVDTSNEALLTIDLSSSLNKIPTPKARIYPNPAKQVLNIDLLENPEECELKIINSLGARIHTQSLNQTHTKMDISHLPNGIYFIVIDQDLANKITFIKE